MKTFVFSICALVVFLSTDGDGCNVIPTYTKPEARELVKCVAENSPSALEEYSKCSGTVMIDLVLDYCIKHIYRTDDLAEAFQRGKRNPEKVDDVYDCVNEHIHSITCHDKYKELPKLEKCFRSIIVKHCSSWAKTRTVQPQIKHKDITCCVADCKRK